MRRNKKAPGESGVSGVCYGGILVLVGVVWEAGEALDVIG